VPEPRQVVRDLWDRFQARDWMPPPNCSPKTSSSTGRRRASASAGVTV
jgi:hypothetical protein